MAHDLVLKSSNRDWSRVGAGDCPDRRPPAPGGFPIVGTAVSLMFACRILSGKWPWYWFSRYDGRR